MAMSFWAAVSAYQEEDNGGVEFWSNPEYSGWLMKQGEYIKTWRRRWFVLKQRKIFWFKESTVTSDSKPRGMIPVTDIVTVKAAEDILNKLNAFQLSTKYDNMYFIADSKKEMNKWLHSIGKSIIQPSTSVLHDEVVDYDTSRRR